MRRISYEEPKHASPQTHHYLHTAENAVRHGQAVARVCFGLRREGYRPDIIIGHPGWGETLFLKDVWPQVPLLTYAEYYYGGEGGDIGFDPADPPDVDQLCRARLRNTHLLLSLEAADAAVSPTSFQKSRHPPALQHKIRRIFDGIDTARVRPDPAAVFPLADGRTLTADNEVLTYVSRNLEPYRGFPQLVRALPAILAARPHAQAVIVGGDEVSYGRPPPGGGTWREAMLAEIPLGPFLGRIHFTGRIPYSRYLALLQISSVHLYLTYPFVLGWSCLEAMAAGCLLVASDTAPVREVVRHGENGLLVPFFDTDGVAKTVVQALASRAEMAEIRHNARQTIVDGFDLQPCLREHVALIQAVASRRF